MNAARSNALGSALRGFFADYLPRIRGVSPHTVLSYRDAFTILLRFLAVRHGRPVIALDFHDLAPNDILAFLDHLELDRSNSVSTRNARLAAIHAFACYAASDHPEHLELCQRILAVPFKRARMRVVEYLEADELHALLDAPDRTTREGRRHHALLLTLFNTGARVQELLDLRPCDLQLDRPFQLRLRGKGRKERMCPLWPQTVEVLRTLLGEQRVDLSDTEPLFRNRRGQPLSRFGVRYLLRKYANRARSVAKTLYGKRVHPHVFRHTTAVHLLQAGVDIVTISHWLGHTSVETTNRYAAVNLEMKRAAIEKAGPLGDVDPALAAWRSDTNILEWLEAL
jgi:integrase/recombinase XerD